ncbi:MAG: Electron transport complex subunit RsxB [Candidatus Ordinivivax streblomastigis]|uniref:Electron transport complex subunit RsxB n=1 Tax=Candidatus Ordinivivax streblomastigis TaxID=2540710 RepID=A0A5M8P2G0_9BACT|nr:MAG: Electron transport complex subunit RsxB [Candidatus Ordinivivax streblomastigis]
MNVVWYIGGAVVAFWLIGGIYRQKKGKNKVIHVVEDNCTGCQRCLKKCRYRVLDKVSDEKGAHVFVKKPNQCTACGDCLSACKFNALEIVKKQ